LDKIEDVNYFPKIEICPVIFEEQVSKDDKDKNEENIIDADMTSTELDYT
jgi:hypothetical protein